MVNSFCVFDPVKVAIYSVGLGLLVVIVAVVLNYLRGLSKIKLAKMVTLGIGEDSRNSYCIFSLY